MSSLVTLCILNTLSIIYILYLQFRTLHLQKIYESKLSNQKIDQLQQQKQINKLRSDYDQMGTDIFKLCNEQAIQRQNIASIQANVSHLTNNYLLREREFNTEPVCSVEAADAQEQVQ
ncbi:MAG: hypothetical protein LKF48_07445 [Prevotella sp.]|jgi:cell division protein FtsB|nr:hypothetical protein [Prevotella sp.]MCH4182973.1 hypothetical protein [Prevotella sp.]